MEIKFKKDITISGQDGLGLLYEVDGNDLEVQISRTFLGMFNIEAYNAEEFFEQSSLDSMIQSIDDVFNKGGNTINKIILDSDGLKIKGQICYSPEELKKFIAVRKK